MIKMKIPFKLLILLFSLSPISLKAVDVKVLKSQKNITFWYVHETKVPVISLAFSFEGGTAQDPQDKAGLTSFFTSMLLEGAGNLKAQALRELLENKGIDCGFDEDKDHIYGSLRTTVEQRKEAATLLKSILHSPRFDDDALRYRKEASLAQIKNYRKSPTHFLKQKSRPLLFGNHPYNKDHEGTLEGIQKISKRDLTRVQKDRFVKGTLKVVLCGNLSSSEAAQMIDEIFGDLPEKGSLSDISKAVMNLSGKDIEIHGPFPQTVAVFFQEGLPRKDPDYYKLALLIDIMGGKSSSRLFREIREKNGLVYTIQAGLGLEEHVQYISGSFGTENKSARNARKMLREQWSQMQKLGASEKELDDAKKGFLGSIAFGFADTMSTAQTLLSLYEDGFKPSYLKAREDMIRSVKISDLNAFAKKFFKPEKLTTFMVGEDLAKS